VPRVYWAGCEQKESVIGEREADPHRVNGEPAVGREGKTAGPVPAVVTRPASLPVEVVFAVIAAVFGLTFAVTMPPLSPPDEVRHLARAYMISEGHLAPPGRAPGAAKEIPRSLAALERLVPHGAAFEPPPRHTRERLSALWRQDLAPERRVDVGFVGVYSPLVYLPQALAVGVGRLLEAPPVALLYLARVANLACWLALCFVAVRRLPARRSCVALLCLSPMSISLAGSASPDAGTNAFALLFVATVFAHAWGGGTRLSRAGLGELTAISCALGLSKPAYAVLLGTLLLIPSERFASTRSRWLSCLLVVAAGILPGLLWLGYLASLDLPQPAQIDRVAQLGGILSDPLHFLWLVVGTLWQQATLQMLTFIGVLGHLNVFMPLPTYGLFGAAVLLLALADGPDPGGLGAPQRVWLLALFAFGVLSVATLAYASWNPVGEEIVVGIQGRYFIPLAPLLAFVVPGLRTRLDQRRVRIAGHAASVVFLVVGVWTLHSAYYD
jgi:hypothetical protein